MILRLTYSFLINARYFTQPTTCIVARLQSKTSQSLMLYPRKEKFILQSNALKMTNQRLFHISTAAWKKKEKKRGKGQAGADKIVQIVDPQDVEEYVDLVEVQSNLEEIVKQLQDDLSQNFRIGGNLSVFEQITVSVENELVSLSDVGQIVKVSPRLVTIDMVAYPELIPQVLAALQDSSLNTNPSVSGSIIKVPISQATAEYRRDLVKKVKQRVGVCKSELHALTTKVTNNIFALQGVSVDVKKNISEQLKLYAQHYVSKADQVFINKETALLNP